ncbi:hypothetical protein [Marinoscillum sp. 108]|uniref:hypothetical protein n=1 Tax=Marinoscillum sp. 108 TaxID=2653151 RepID=UPI00135A9ED4|nr:hypothetical protein [Marinoscillum sp. 108]
MWSNLSYQQKTLMMVSAAVLLLVVGYFAAFQKTIRIHQENEYLSALTQKGERQLIAEIAQLSTQKRQIDSLKAVVTRASSKAEIFAVLVSRSEQSNLQIVEINETSKEGAERYECTFSGLYVNMVKFIRFVESDFKSVTLESLDFHKEFERKTGVTHLRVKMILRKNEYGS